MPSIEQLSIQYLKDIQEAYRIDMRNKGMDASGGTSAAIRIELNKNGGKVLGPSHIFQLMFGRKPGTFPPRQAMIKYIESRRIEPSAGTSIESLAYLFARKLALKGSDIFLGKRPALSIEARQSELTRKLFADVGNQYKIEVANKLRSIK